MHPVVLAAGQGRRIANETEDYPKLFIDINGQTIFDRLLDVLSPHFNKMTVALGYGFTDEELSQDDLPDLLQNSYDIQINTVFIDEWETVENAYSCLKAFNVAPNDDLLLICGDIVIKQYAIDYIISSFEDLKSKQSLVTAIEGVQNEMTSVNWDSNGIITSYGDIRGHQEAGIFILNQSHIDQAAKILQSNSNSWFPTIFTNVDSKRVLINEHSQFEINTSKHLRIASQKI